MKNNKLLWIYAIGLAGTGAYLLIRRITDRLTASVKWNRFIVACRTDACTMLAGTDTVKLDMPMFPAKYYSDNDVSLIVSKLNSIKTSYGNIMASVARMVNLPELLVRGFSFIESAGDKNAVGGRAVGLMQVDPVTANDIIFLENKKGRLSEAEKAVLRKYLGTRLDKILKMPYMGYSINVTSMDLLNPEFNILVGSIYLGILVDESTEAGIVRLDKVVARYNRGYFSKSGLTGDKFQVLQAQPSVTQAYILKLAGKNGVLDIMTA